MDSDNQEKDNANQENQDNQDESKEKKKSDPGCIILLVVLFFAMFFLLKGCFYGGSNNSSSKSTISLYSPGGISSPLSSDGYTATCLSCNRKYKAGDRDGNYRSISKTNMCVNCYKNFELTESLRNK